MKTKKKNDILLVSWLMPMYNNGNSARKAIDSMLAQTYKNFEVIIVLDPSDEETVSLCKEYEKMDTRIHLIQNKERLGITGSLNVGLKNCKGKYIARMDADDYTYPDRLEKQVDYMEQHPEVGILGGNARYIEETMPSYTIYKEIPNSEEIRVKLLFSYCFANPTIMFRNETGIQYPNHIAEDYAFAAERISKTRMEILPDVVLDYYVHQESASHSNFNNVRKDSAEISRKTIQRELGIDTIKYSDSLFGWRDMDKFKHSIKDFLHMHFQLIQQIIKENERQSKFDLDTLIKVLNEEWKKSLWLARPYNYLPDLNRPVEQLTFDMIENAFSKLDNEALCINDIMQKIEKIVVYGTGKYCKDYLKTKEQFFLDKIVCFCDTNPLRQGILYMKKEIISPEQLKDIEYDVIAIASPKYEKEIKEELHRQGISNDKIISLSMYEIIEFHKKRNKL